MITYRLYKSRVSDLRACLSTSAIFHSHLLRICASAHSFRRPCNWWCIVHKFPSDCITPSAFFRAFARCALLKRQLNESSVKMLTMRVFRWDRMNSACVRINAIDTYTFYTIICITCRHASDLERLLALIIAAQRKKWQHITHTYLCNTH